jgi:predicted DNA-binding protein
MQDKTKALNLRIDETAYERLDAFCKACGMTKRKAVEKAITDFVEKNQRFAKEMKNSGLD